MPRLLDLTKSGLTITQERLDPVWQTWVGDWGFEVEASMWLEGLFEEDPGTRGLAGMLHNVVLRHGDKKACLEHAYLSHAGLTLDYLPTSWQDREEDFREFVSAGYTQLLDEGLWQDNYSASLLAAKGPHLEIRKLPRIREPWNSSVSAKILNRFYQRCYTPDQKGNPVSSHLRWVSSILSEDLSTFYGNLVCLEDEAANEVRLLDRTTTIPMQGLRELFVEVVKNHREFVNSLTQSVP